MNLLLYYENFFGVFIGKVMAVAFYLEKGRKGIESILKNVTGS